MSIPISGQSFTFQDAAAAIKSHIPVYQYKSTPIDHEPVGKEEYKPGQPRQYVKRTLSYLLVPLIAVAILGTNDASLYFPPLPTSSSWPAMRTARFSFYETVVALSQIMLSGTVTIHSSDIQPNPKDRRTLYFSESLQTNLLDQIFIRFPLLYASITRAPENEHCCSYCQSFFCSWPAAIWQAGFCEPCLSWQRYRLSNADFSVLFRICSTLSAFSSCDPARSDFLQ